MCRSRVGRLGVAPLGGGAGRSRGAGAKGRLLPPALRSVRALRAFVSRRAPLRSCPGRSVLAPPVARVRLSLRSVPLSSRGRRARASLFALIALRSSRSARSPPLASRLVACSFLRARGTRRCARSRPVLSLRYACSFLRARALSPLRLAAKAALLRRTPPASGLRPRPTGQPPTCQPGSGTTARHPCRPAPPLCRVLAFCFLGSLP